MTDTEVKTDLTPLDADGRVRGDVPCLKCEYNLRTLAAVGLCPECGLPVARSIRGDLLGYAAPAWVRLLADGAEAMYGCTLAAIVSLGAAVAGALFAWIGGAGMVLGVFAIPVAAGAGCAAPIMAIFGVVLLTSPEPRISERPEGLSARRVCRFTPLACVILLVMALILTGVAGTPWFMPMILAALGLVLCVSLPLSFIAHLISLVRRIPSPLLARRTRRLQGVLYAFAGLLLVLIILSQTSGVSTLLTFLVAR